MLSIKWMLSGVFTLLVGMLCIFVTFGLSVDLLFCRTLLRPACDCDVHRRFGAETIGK